MMGLTCTQIVLFRFSDARGHVNLDELCQAIDGQLEVNPS